MRLLGDDPIVLGITRDMIKLAQRCAADGNMDDLAKVQAFLRELLDATDRQERDAKVEALMAIPSGGVLPLWARALG